LHLMQGSQTMNAMAGYTPWVSAPGTTRPGGAGWIVALNAETRQNIRGNPRYPSAWAGLRQYSVIFSI
jgi:hypothetical protein